MNDRLARGVAVTAVVIGVASCAGGNEGAGQDRATDPVGPVASTVATLPTPEPAAAGTNTTATVVTTTDAPATTLAPTAGSTATSAVGTAATAAPKGDGVGNEDIDEIDLGRSVEGRPITAIRRGTPGGTPVLVVGVIHGDEDAGAAIVDVLRRLPVPDGIELWLVPSMNPDGQAAGTRHNANGVDLNRNFPTNWAPLAQPGDWQYAGTGPATEPEIQAMLELSEHVRPRLTLWYHQDLFRINPAAGLDGAIRQRYADLTGLPVIAVTGGTYTGTASQWSRAIAAEGGIGFTVELGATLSDAGARQHAESVLTVASEL